MDPSRFDHDDAGRPEDEWRALPQWAAVPALVPRSTAGEPPDRLVVVVAHPDDETLAMSGLLTWADRADVDCHVVVATDGEGSHPGSPTYTAEDLRSIRRVELASAIEVLCPSAHVVRLGLPDGRVAETPDPIEEALVDLVDPSTLVVSTWRHDAHTDHEAVARVAALVAAGAGARHLEAPIWLWHWGSVDDVPWEDCRILTLDDEQQHRRSRALAAYASQHRPLSADPADTPVLAPGMLEHFTRPTETYVEHGHARSSGARTSTTRSGGVFERLHGATQDPWALADSWYERRKRDVALATLPAARLGTVLEIGCSVGVLTAQLARRADEVVAVDVSESALAQARRLLEDGDGGRRVRLDRLRVPQEWPPGLFDTVVLSEIGYFLTRPQWHEVLDRAFVCARDSVLVVHWRHPVAGWPLDGPMVHELACTSARSHGFRVATSVVDEDFLLDLLRRDDRAGIAEQDGKS